MAETTIAPAYLQWQGNHTAAEEWATEILEAHTGRELTSAVFMGDCRGIYIDPERLADHGVTSLYLRPALVEHGQVIEWNGREFVVTTMARVPVDAFVTPAREL